MIKGEWIDGLPQDIENDIGELLMVQKEVPGVYYIFTRKDNQPSFGQYYIVERSSPAISLSAKKYGKRLSNHHNLLSFNIEDVSSGQKIVEFEAIRYKLKHEYPEVTEKDLRDAACAGMETNPEFFGYFPVPAATPWGRLIRYKVLSNGIYWIETDQIEPVLAICDVYEDDLYDGTRESAVRLKEEDQSPWTFSYLFYPYNTSCIPLFELLPTHYEWIESNMIDKAALMNAIWEYHPEYATAYNTNEVMGCHDGIGNLLRSLGELSQLNTSADHTVMITPDAGTCFCKLFE